MGRGCDGVELERECEAAGQGCDTIVGKRKKLLKSETLRLFFIIMFY